MNTIQMEEQLIKFETAKKAKEKAFDEVCQYFYYPDGIHFSSAQERNSTLKEGNISAPTQALLQKWLREEHNINIRLTFFNTTHNLWTYRIHYSECYGTDKTYEEALEKGLLEALKLIETK